MLRALDLRPGMVIGDKYRVETMLGRGGFGVVVRAVHLALGQRVAIKVLMAGDSGESDWAVDVERFRREAQATAVLRSDHVVRVLDVDILDRESPYVVMEYLEGETLHEAVRRRGPFAIDDAVDAMIQVLAALGEAHAAGIVHRDLKPANVFLVKRAGAPPLVKVLDFGVSKVGGGIAALTRTGAVLGTVAYMAPEQLRDSKRVDARADLWSVGMILYEMLTARPPFGVISPTDAVGAILARAPTPLASLRAGVPPPLEQAVARCLAKTPEQRFGSAGEVAAALAPFATSRVRAALDLLQRLPPPKGAASAPPRTTGKALGGDAMTGLMAAIIGVMLGVVFGAVYVLRGHGRSVAEVPLPSSPAAPTPTPAAPPSASPEPSAAPLSANPCDPPFYFDETGIKQYKRECL